jgi:allophanate hydrolase subunit 2
MVLGAVQVPPDGRPVVFLADHPTTGGYPVVGVVRGRDLAGAAQAAPGTPVRFVPVPVRR